MRHSRDIPAYPIGEAARYVRVPSATLRSWVLGRPYPKAGGVGHFTRLIHPADQGGRILSFNNLVEAHVLRALRGDHGLQIKEIRKAISFAEKEMQIEQLLLNKKLLTDGKHVLLERYGSLIDLSRSCQIAMRNVLEAHLRRGEWDDDELPRRLFPMVRDVEGGKPTITIDPAIGFGRPVLISKGISTQVIVDRIDAGESIETLAKDYDVTTAEVEEAAVYERAA